MDNIMSPNKDQFNCTFPTQNTVTAPGEKKKLKNHHFYITFNYSL